MTEERRSAIFPAGTTARVSHHRKTPTRRKQDLNLGRTREFRLSWMKLCSSDNHITTAPRHAMKYDYLMLLSSFIPFKRDNFSGDDSIIIGII